MSAARDPVQLWKLGEKALLAVHLTIVFAALLAGVALMAGARAVEIREFQAFATGAWGLFGVAYIAVKHKRQKLEYALSDSGQIPELDQPVPTGCALFIILALLAGLAYRVLSH